MKISNRIQYLDVVKMIAIFAVVMGHLLQYNVNYGTVNDGYKYDSLFLIIYSFHMQLFMYVSGLFFSSSLALPVMDLVKKKAKQLLLPAYVWKITFLVLSVFLTFITLGYVDINISKADLLKPYWFLTCLFLCYILSSITLKCIKNKYMGGGLLCIIVNLLPNFDFCYLNSLLPFFWLGFWTKNLVLTMRRKHCVYSAFISLLLFVFLFRNFKYDMTMYEHACQFINFEELNVVHPSIFKIMMYRNMLALVAITFIISLSKLIFNRVHKIISEIGMNSMGIYLIQGWLIFRIRDIQMISINNIIIRDYVILPLITIVTILTCIYILRIIRKRKYLKLLYLGK